jgi:Ran GTPase-activating protein (RanGAP) involved in mRNA processing and transport
MNHWLEETREITKVIKEVRALRVVNWNRRYLARMS